MVSALDELKSLLLTHSIEFWDSIETGTDILNALQSLLKAAELNLYTSSDSSSNEQISSDETEFWSPLQSLDQIKLESEDENSEEETSDGSFNTADDGYEADAENYINSENSYDVVRSTIIPSSKFRSNIIHSGICRIVVEILFELSKKCLDDPNFWPGLLYQILTRLSVIRSVLGGSVFLIKGFSPVLESNDIRIRELQKSILELIDDLQTPDSLTAFLSLLASENPPVDLLLPRISYLANLGMKISTNCFVEFSGISENFILSSCDLYLTKNIKGIYDFHNQQNIKSPLTQSKLISPLNYINFDPWNLANGFTATTWILLNENVSNLEKTHLLSLGNEKLIFSVYLNPNDSISIDLQRYELNDYIKKNKNTIEPVLPVIKIEELDFDKENQSEDLENERINLCQKFKNTKTAFKNSFSSFNLFSETKNSTQENDLNKNPVEIKKLNLTKNKWTHLSFSVEILPKHLLITLTVDGTDEHSIEIPTPLIHQFVKHSKLPILCIGDKNENSIKFSLSNLMIFNEPMKEANLGYLVGLGPDCSNLKQCLTENIKPNLGFLNHSKLFSLSDLKNVEILKILGNSLVVCYSAHKPNILIGYKNGDSGEVMGMITFGSEVKMQPVKSFQTAVMLSGGLSTLLILFARIVELSSSPFLQSTALNLLLQMAHSNSEMYTEFIQKNTISLIGAVLRTPKCVKGIFLLKSILDISCDAPVLSKRTGSDKFQVISNTNACIIHPDLLISVINRYSDWCDYKKDESEILDILFETILALVREKHLHQELNILRLTRSGLISSLLNFCKIYLVGFPRPIYISKIAAEYLVALISVFAGAPPSSSLLDEIMKLLLLLQRPSDSFVTHDRSKFYFLLSSNLPSKKRLSLPITSRRISQSIKIRERKATVPSRNIDYDLPKLVRSASFESIHTIPTNGSLSKEEKNFVNNKFENSMENKENSLLAIADCSRNKKVLNLLDSGDNKKLSKIIANLQIKEQRLMKKRKMNRRIKFNGEKFTDSETDREESKFVVLF